MNSKEELTVLAHDMDECQCGDYRKSHADGVKSCAFNRSHRNVGHHGAPDCERFRLSRTYQARQAIIKENSNAVD